MLKTYATIGVSFFSVVLVLGWHLSLLDLEARTEKLAGQYMELEAQNADLRDLLARCEDDVDIWHEEAEYQEAQADTCKSRLERWAADQDECSSLETKVKNMREACAVNAKQVMEAAEKAEAYGEKSAEHAKSCDLSTRICTDARLTCDALLKSVPQGD